MTNENYDRVNNIKKNLKELCDVKNDLVFFNKINLQGYYTTLLSLYITAKKYSAIISGGCFILCSPHHLTVSTKVVAI